MTGNVEDILIQSDAVYICMGYYMNVVGFGVATGVLPTTFWRRVLLDTLLQCQYEGKAA